MSPPEIHGLHSCYTRLEIVTSGRRGWMILTDTVSSTLEAVNDGILFGKQANVVVANDESGTNNDDDRSKRRSKTTEENSKDENVRKLFVSKEWDLQNLAKQCGSLVLVHDVFHDFLEA
jgi:hypothetical protein